MNLRMNPTKDLSVKSKRAELASETMSSIDALGLDLKASRQRHEQELNGWERSKSRLKSIVSAKGESEQSRALAQVADANIQNISRNIERMDAELDRLRDLRARAAHAQSTFEVFEDTQYLMQKSGLANSLPSPETELQQIRRDVFNLEGYKEILS